MSSTAQQAARRIRPRALVAALALTSATALALLALRPRAGLASDHQDTPEVELNQRMDINDLYVFPGSAPDRVALALTVASPITPAQAAAGYGFDPNVLYQIKVDNTGDATEDLVFQVTFEGSGAAQTVHVRGPVKPSQTGVTSTLLSSGAEVTGATNTMLGSATGMQVYAGLRDDPFWIDLETFMRILPDRKPVTGPLSQIPDTQTATSWRTPGVDFLRGLNALAVVIELPAAQLTAGGTPKLGVWATTSR